MHERCSPQALEAAALVSSHQLEEHLLLTRLNAAQMDDVNSGEGAGSAQLGDDPVSGLRQTGSGEVRELAISCRCGGVGRGCRGLRGKSGSWVPHAGMGCRYCVRFRLTRHTHPTSR